METESGAVETTVDSTEAPGTEATVDTAPAQEQTPDLDRLVSDLEKNWDKIPAEKRQMLDKHFQPAFNRRVNWLNEAVANGFKEAGIKMPEGKTALDLVTENDGKGLGEYFQGLVKSEIEPVKQVIETAQFNQNIQAARDMALQDMPELKQHLEAAVNLIESRPDLLAIARSNGGRGFYNVLRGVGADMELQRLRGILDKNSIATKTANGTTRAGAGAPKTQTTAKLTGNYAEQLRQASRMALEKVKSGQESD